MTHLLLVRHGTTDDHGRVLSGDSDLRLNEAGRAQVRALGARLAQLEVAAVYHSPVARTRETAALLAERLGLQPRACDELAEVRFGAWAGRAFAQLDREPSFQRWNSFRSAARPPDGELMVQVQARAIAGLERLRGEHPDQVVVVVSHADVIKAAIAYFLGVPLDLFQRIEISPASVSALRLDAHSVTVSSVNDTAGQAPCGP
jgi:probable phosphomutase (TIGR03848 family)